MAKEALVPLSMEMQIEFGPLPRVLGGNLTRGACVGQAFQLFLERRSLFSGVFQSMQFEEAALDL